MTSGCAWILAVGLLVLLPAPVAADRVGAEAHFEMSEKARAKGELDAAEASLRKAVEEDETFLPARLALGEALLARGNVVDGLVEVRAAGTLAADPAAASAWPAVVARARKRAQEVEVTSSALAAKASKHVADCLALATRWADKDPDLARGVLQRVLRLVPDHAEAAERLRALTPVQQGTLTLLFQAPEATKCFGLLEGWKIGGGEVHAAGGREGGGIWMQEEVQGDFDLRAEARLLESLGTPLVMGLTVIHGVGDISSFALAEGLLRWEELTQGPRTSVFEKAPAAVGYDPARWTLFEMRFRDEKAQGWLDGKLVCEVPRRNPKGPVLVGMRFQQARVEFRRVELFVPEAR